MSRERPFAVFDIDGTLIRWQLYHAIADAIVKLGYASTDDYQTVKAARMDWKQRTESESFRIYESHLVAAYESVLTKLTYIQFDTAIDLVFDEYKNQVYTFTRDLIKKLKSSEYLLFAISGSQYEIVQKIAEHYGFDDCVGTLYERGEKGFTGKVTTHRHDKHVILDKLVKKHRASYDKSIAVGDSEGDITMLEAVKNPVAFNPTAKLFAEAQKNNWRIVVERKNMIYKLESKNGKYVLAQTN